MTAKRKATPAASKKKKTAAKSTTRKVSTKTKAAARSTAKKEAKTSAPSKAKAGGRKVKKKGTKATKAGTSRAPASRKTVAKSGRRPATPAKRKVASKRTRRRPSLDLGGFQRRLAQMQAEMFQAYMNAKGDSRNRESDGTEDYIDYAVNSYDREFLLSLTELEQNRLSLVNEALARIERGGFGLCTQCQRAIPAKRLEVQPWARYCVACQELADSGLVDDGLDFPSDEDDEDDVDEEAADIEEVGLDATLDDDETPDASRLISG